MADVKVTNLVKFHALCLLAERPHHGYEVIKETSRKLGRQASPGQIYPFLKQLERSGYIRVRSTGDRDRKQYALTPRGKAFVHELFDRFSAVVHLAVEKQLRTCAHCGCEIYRGGVKATVRGKAAMFCCSSCAAAYRRA
ncbi:MAG: PadR family transcriptional regulator [Candidatus Aenigmarchaeota archaeon]|nr:PadR family transcriptional regulator [Candidatus Aenigmarchaeota archaeon]